MIATRKEHREPREKPASKRKQVQAGKFCSAPKQIAGALAGSPPLPVVPHKPKADADLSRIEIDDSVLSPASSALTEEDELLENDFIIRLNAADSRRLFEIIENPPKPNKFLKAALKKYKEIVRE